MAAWATCSVADVRPPLATAAALLLVLAACSSNDDPSSVTGDADPGASAELPTGALQAVSVIGSGRAVQAASASGTTSLVATTIGLDVVDENGGTTPVAADIDPPASEVTVSPDGRFAMVEGSARSELWSIEATPSLIAAFEAPTRGMFTADSSTLVTSSPFQVTAAAVTSSPETVITAPADSQLGTAAITPDGAVIAVPVTGEAADLFTYTAETGANPVDVFVEPERRITRADFGGRADRLVLEVTSGDPFEGQLAAWDPGTAELVWETAAGQFTPGAAWDVGADGRVLVADGSTLRLIGVDGGLDAEWPLGDTRTATGLVATESGYAVALSDRTLLLAGADGDPSGPTVATGQRIVDLNRLAGADGVIAVDAVGIVRTWGADGTTLNAIDAFQAGAVNAVAVSADDSHIAAASNAATVTVVDVAGSEPPLVLDHPEGNVDSVAFSPDGSQVVTGVGERLSDISFDDTVSLWRLDDGVRTVEFGGEGEDVNGCANFRNTVVYSPDGDLFAATSHDFTVGIHRADTGEVVTTLPPHVSSVLDVTFSPSGERLVTTSDDGAVRVWNTDGFTLLNEYLGPPGGYWSAAFMPDGNSLVVSDLTGALRLIGVSDGTELLAFDGVTSRTGRPAVSPDGTLVAAASDGNSVGVWSTSSGALLTQASGHAAPVTSAAFTSDGGTLVTGSNDATVRLWRVG